ncbi:hypothetical protein ASL83_003161 [Vibrio parahaemolyticus]|uniref:Uncharacterized protein n=1 Tax=Vibrio parahaemolyticus TaxID=670 RepID=A0A9Q3UA32_VIBPH|nr:hypothetical protein [Vibrio parahaemolyticus]EJE4724393.1 hypothetical protein [Vibrio parahaemolyticus]MCC3803945.1 hypothetical protein [Vibrio parahaemolyticus]
MNNRLVILLCIAMLAPNAFAEAAQQDLHFASLAEEITNSTRTMGQIFGFVMVISGIYYSIINPNALMFLMCVGGGLVIMNLTSLVDTILASTAENPDIVINNESSSGGTFFKTLFFLALLPMGYFVYTQVRDNGLSLRRFSRIVSNETASRSTQTQTSQRSRDEIKTILDVGESRSRNASQNTRKPTRSPHERNVKIDESEEGISIFADDRPVVRSINFDSYDE